MPERRVIVLLVAGLGVAAVVIAFLLGRQFPVGGSDRPAPGASAASVTPSGTGTASTPTSSGSTTPPGSSSSTTAAPTSAAPSSSTSTLPPISPSVSVSGRPGANVLAASGTGPSQSRFTPAGSTWQMKASYDCGSGTDEFVVTVTAADGSVAAVVRGTGRGEDLRTLQRGGAFVLAVSGSCRWTLEATG
jgi:cytoskeletal protein RodZ